MCTRSRALFCLALALLLAACGKSSRNEPAPADVAGAAGVATQESGGGANHAGAPAEPSEAGAATGGGSPGGAYAGGAAGAGSLTDCADLSCLEGADLVYHPVSRWQEPGGGVQGMGDTATLAATDYVKRVGIPTIALHFSGDATQLDMTPTAGGDTTHGTRDATHTDQAWYALDLFAGGRFVVRFSDGALYAEHTVYGSGKPIVSSTRGWIE